MQVQLDQAKTQLSFTDLLKQERDYLSIDVANLRSQLQATEQQSTDFISG